MLRLLSYQVREPTALELTREEDLDLPGLLVELQYGGPLASGVSVVFTIKMPDAGSDEAIQASARQVLHDAVRTLSAALP